jgi:Xaa-Pro aminopeptidase
MDIVNAVSLREGRLARLQASMKRYDVDACLLFNPANVRYATGATTMTVYCLGSFVRCALVPAEGRPILFEYPNAMHLFTDIEAELRPFTRGSSTKNPKPRPSRGRGKPSRRCANSA